MRKAELTMRTARTSRAGWFAVVMVAVAPSARATAQPRPTRWYVMFGVTTPQQGGLRGEAYQTYVSAPGGRTVGWLLGAGMPVGSATSLELELSTTGVMSAREPSRYDITYDEERQDRTLSLALRFHVRPARAVGIEPLLGVCLVETRAWSQAEYYSHSIPRQLLTVDPKERKDVPMRPGLVGGLGLRFGTAHAAFVPSLYVQATRAGDATASAYPGGFPVWTVRPGVAVRFEF